MLEFALGLERTQHFATLPGRTGHLKFPGHVLPDRTNTGPPFFSKTKCRVNSEKTFFFCFRDPGTRWYLGVPVLICYIPKEA